MNNEPDIFTKEEEAELATLFKKRNEEARAKEEARKKLLENYKIQQIIESTEATANRLYPDIPTIKPQKSIGKKKTPCNLAKDIAKTSIIFGKYLFEETVINYKNFKSETKTTICQMFILTSIAISGMSTIALELPISFFIEYGITPALIAGAIETIVNPEVRKSYIDKFKNYLFTKEFEKEQSGRRQQK